MDVFKISVETVIIITCMIFCVYLNGCKFNEMSEEILNVKKLLAAKTACDSEFYHKRPIEYKSL